MPGAVRPPAAGTGVYAALDLGTNNCRLLIACPTGDGFRVVNSFSRIIRLGEGISATGCISEAAIDRAIAALEHLPRQDPVAKGEAPAADRNRGLPRRLERRRLSGPGRRRNRHPARSDRPRDRGSAGRASAARRCSIRRGAAPSCSISAADRPNWCGSSAIRAGTTPRRASRRGCRSRSAWSRLAEQFRRQGCHAAVLCGDGAGGRQTCGAFRGRAWRRSRRHASARHLRHGDDAGRRFISICCATIAAASTASG